MPRTEGPLWVQSRSRRPRTAFSVVRRLRRPNARPRGGAVYQRCDCLLKLGFRKTRDRGCRRYNGVGWELTMVFATPWTVTTLIRNVRPHEVATISAFIVGARRRSDIFTSQTVTTLIWSASSMIVPAGPAKDSERGASFLARRATGGFPCGRARARCCFRVDMSQVGCRFEAAAFTQGRVVRAILRLHNLEARRSGPENSSCESGYADHVRADAVCCNYWDSRHRPAEPELGMKSRCATNDHASERLMIEPHWYASAASVNCRIFCTKFVDGVSRAPGNSM